MTSGMPSPRWPGLILGFTLAVLGAWEASAHGYKKDSISVVHPWTTETTEAHAMVVMTVRNAGKRADRLIGVSTPLAPECRLLAAGSGDGKVVVVPAFELGANDELVMKKEGPFIEIEGLRKRLSAYDRLPLVLEFERAGRMEIEVMVEGHEE